MKYIWQGKKARVNYTLLSRKKKGGGVLALPDIKRYYYAVILARLAEWTKIYTKKKWVQMEDTISWTQLNKNVWIPPKLRKIGTDTHSITKNVFKIWDTLYRREKWEYNSPLIPLAGTHFFPPVNKTRMGKYLGTKRLGEVVTQGKIRSRNDLQTQEGV